MPILMIDGELIAEIDPVVAEAFKAVARVARGTVQRPAEMSIQNPIEQIVGFGFDAMNVRYRGSSTLTFITPIEFERQAIDWPAETLGPVLARLGHWVRR